MRSKITIRIDDATESGLSAIAFREGRTVGDVIRRFIRAGIDGYQPADKRPLPPNPAKITALSTSAAAGLNEALRVFTDNERMEEQKAYLQMLIDRLPPTSSLVGEPRTSPLTEGDAPHDPHVEPTSFVARTPPFDPETDAMRVRRRPR